MRFGDLGAPELILIVVALVLVFGASKLGDIGGALGKSVREFKRAQRDDDEPVATVADAPAAPPVTESAAARPAAPGSIGRTTVADYRPGRMMKAE